MRIFIRVDASQSIGTGHLNRCLNLADALQLKGHKSLFAMNVSDLNFRHKILIRGHKVVNLHNHFSQIDNHNAKLIQEKQFYDAEECLKILKKYQPDLSIVDHYNLDYNWENIIRPVTNKILVIDDLANRKHNCDFLLDQTPIRNYKDYANLVGENTTLLIGPQYSILHPDFNLYRNENETRPISQDNLVVGIGGIDSNNLIPKILDYLEQSPKFAKKQIHILISSMAPQIKFLEKIINSSPLQVKLHVEAQNFVQLLASADLAISAGGLMSLELACLGIPAVILPLTKIQGDVATKLAEEINFIVANDWQNNFESSLSICFEFLLKTVSASEKRRVHNEIDGLGMTRLIDYIINYA